MKAKDAGAKVICVDPRFTRSASKADLYVPLRSGTDIAFLGGMINYILQNKLYFGFAWLPKLDPGMNCSWLMIFDNMIKNKFKGFFAWGQNPACSGTNSTKVRNALAKLEWMVTVNLFDNETASFWKCPGVDSATVKTEVFRLPAAASYEKEGSITNSGRWAQWRYKAVNPLGQSKPDAEIIHELYQKLKQMYAKEGGALPEQLLNLTWNYGPAWQERPFRNRPVPGMVMGLAGQPPHYL
jgi:anaerobic selenocysteine-containing dehydrogenase